MTWGNKRPEGGRGTKTLDLALKSPRSSQPQHIGDLDPNIQTLGDTYIHTMAATKVCLSRIKTRTRQSKEGIQSPYSKATTSRPMEVPC
jgi:hypothetical protein